MRSSKTSIALFLALACSSMGVFLSRANAASAPQEKWLPQLEEYCLNCHEGPDEKGDTDLEEALFGDFSTQIAVWEKTARQLRARQMPPLDRKRPSDAQYDELAYAIESAIAPKNIPIPEAPAPFDD